MAIYFDATERLIIPRWRKYNPDSLSGEHKPLLIENPNSTEKPINPRILQKIHEWSHYPTIGNAWELVNSAYINRDHKIAHEAARFLLANVQELSPNFRKMVLEVLGEPENIEATKNQPIGIHLLLENIDEEVNLVKNKLRFYLRNDILWLELGRLYAIKGELRKAEQCVNISLYFSNKKSRYYLRAASRFFYHIGQFDTAQSIVRMSPFLKNDPWLLSADISYSNKMKRSPVNLKNGFSILESKNFHNAAISELAGVLATNEFHHNDIKRARKLVKQSLLAPNDNSLAQAEWLGQDLGDISINPWIEKVELSFEARSFEFINAKLYEKSLDEAKLWISDQPFSKRACHFLTYLCTGLTNNYETAIEWGEIGRTSNKKYFPILNNLAYAYTSIGDFYNAEIILGEMTKLAEGPRQQIYAWATAGYYYFRKKDIISGRENYQKAIEGARKANLPKLKDLAEANYLRECCLSGQLQAHVAISAIKKLEKANKEEVKHIIETLEEMIAKAQH